MLTGDYLEHKALYAALKDWLVEQAAERGSLRIADLGCGDSDYIAHIMAAGRGR